MVIDEIKKNLNFELGAKLSSFFISKKDTITLIKEVKLDEKILIGFIDILSSSSIVAEVKHYLNSDQILLDIPLTERFLKTFANPLVSANHCRETKIGIQVYYFVRDLIYGEGAIPHFLTLHLYVHNLSDNELEIQEKLPNHIIDLGSYDKKGQVIGAAIYLEAMATKASEKSLGKDKARISWKERLRRKKQKNGNSYRPDFFDHTQHLQENRILSKEVCEALHNLRKVRNIAAHNFEILKTESHENPCEYIQVTQIDHDFISAASAFVASCRELYGPVPKAFGKDIFKRYTELLAGDINKFAKVQSVLTLGLQYSKELEDIFG